MNIRDLLQAHLLFTFEFLVYGIHLDRSDKTGFQSNGGKGVESTHREFLASSSLEPCRRTPPWVATPLGHREIPRKCTGSGP